MKESDHSMEHGLVAGEAPFHLLGTVELPLSKVPDLTAPRALLCGCPSLERWVSPLCVCVVVFQNYMCEN